jgi:hypothetical protein
MWTSLCDLQVLLSHTPLFLFGDCDCVIHEPFHFSSANEGLEEHAKTAGDGVKNPAAD